MRVLTTWDEGTMLTIESVEKKFADFYQTNRQSIVGQLAAQGVSAPEATADRIIAETARAVAPGTLEDLRKGLIRSYSDTPEYLSLLMASEDTPENQPRSEFIAGAIERRRLARAWLDRQVAAELDRLTIEISPGLSD
jgi:hypothetical protein